MVWCDMRWEGAWSLACFASLCEISKATHDPRKLFNFSPIAEHGNRNVLFANAFSEIAVLRYGIWLLNQKCIYAEISATLSRVATGTFSY